MILGGTVFRKPSGGVETLRTTDTHTGYIATSGTVSESSTSGGYTAWKLMDKNLSGASKWLSPVGVLTGWLKYEFATTGKVKNFRFYSPTLNGGGNASARQPRNFTIQVSSNDIDWTTVMTVTDAVRLTTNGWSEVYTIPLPVDAKYVKMDMTLNWGDTNYLSLQELELNYVEGV